MVNKIVFASLALLGTQASMWAQESSAILIKNADVFDGLHEQLIKGAVVNPAGMTETESTFDVEAFKANPDAFTIVDIRSADEHKNTPIFEESINIPLHELRERAGEIPADKPVVVHCAGGYRSAAGSSIVTGALKGAEVLDFSEAIKDFQEVVH